MIDPIQACGGCGRCAACVAQMPPVPAAPTTGGGAVAAVGTGAMPPPMGAPHEQAMTTLAMPPAMGAPHEQAAADQPAPPPAGTTDGDGGPPPIAEGTWIPIDDVANASTAAAAVAPVVPARVEIPIVPIEMPDTTIPPLGLEDQY